MALQENSTAAAKNHPTEEGGELAQLKFQLLEEKFRCGGDLRLLGQE
jgi:hypothetical protein